MKDRCISRRAFLNARDLGGLRTQGGVIRRKVIFRSGTLRFLTDKDGKWLYSNGITRYVDFRTPKEIAIDIPTQTLVGAGLNYTNVPVYGGAPMGQPSPNSYAVEYLRMIENRAIDDALKVLVLFISRGEKVIAGCELGKDRTGVISAIVLSLLGVSNEDIADDYALSGPQLLGHAGRCRVLLKRMKEPDETFLRRLAVHPETMLTVLNGLEDSFGGARAIAQRAGIESRHLDGFSSVVVSSE